MQEPKRLRQSSLEHAEQTKADHELVSGTIQNTDERCKTTKRYSALAGSLCVVKHLKN